MPALWQERSAPVPGAAGWESRDGWDSSGARRKYGPAADKDVRAPAETEQVSALR